MKKILVVLAHPDDESFGPSATLVKYASRGVKIHLLLATKGEAGENYLKRKSTKTLDEIRELEAKKAAKIIGIEKLEFLGFHDGELKQNNYFPLAQKIINKIKKFKPDVIMTFEPRGISGHLDHIAVSLTTTYAFLKTKIARKLYYACLPQSSREKRGDDYYIYFPNGYPEKEITTRIEVNDFWPTKMKALLNHQSQIQDPDKILKMVKERSQIDHFLLQFPKPKKGLRETDLFEGISTS